MLCEVAPHFARIEYQPTAKVDLYLLRSPKPLLVGSLVGWRAGGKQRDHVRRGVGGGLHVAADCGGSMSSSAALRSAITGLNGGAVLPFARLVDLLVDYAHPAAVGTRAVRGRSACRPPLPMRGRRVATRWCCEGPAHAGATSGAPLFDPFIQFLEKCVAFLIVSAEVLFPTLR